MEVRYLPDDRSYERMTTEELRSVFVLDSLFATGEVRMTYCDADRAILGGAIPLDRPLHLQSSKKEMAANYFAERREIGIVNIGGEGVVSADKADFRLGTHDMVYIGRGTQEVRFSSSDRATPAVFYFASFPAHTACPSRMVHRNDAEHQLLGDSATSNKRTINRYIHTGGAKSCQLVMGMTELDTGSVWNTMPPHTHQRRMEAYLYYDLGPDDIVVHLMGRPDATRNLILRNRQVVVSPSWSIHCAAATKNYRFVWAMGGENQEFGDMDAVAMTDLR
ncbi:MAG TPA: 5-dehydro-4-deoxy-D-glucuronate isomerase [Bacteroidota bacterium]|nr:5-dehydro-4-deoxy-D-glucuronate isomerase [Bacteroidota bacterium]